MLKNTEQHASPRPARAQSQPRIRRLEGFNVTGKARYVIDHAKNGDVSIISLGGFIFFSTEAGDAWMLEPQEKLALCLMQDREKQPFRIVETPSNFAVEWEAHYHIDGSAFIVTKKSGEAGIRLDYPTEQIVQMTRPAGKG